MKQSPHLKRLTSAITAVGRWLGGMLRPLPSALSAVSRGMGARLPKQLPIALKLAITFTLLIASGMIILGLLVGSNQSMLLEQQVNKFGSTLVQRMAESTREPLLANDGLNLELVVNTLTRDENIEGAAIFSDDRQLVVKAGAIPPLSLLNSEGFLTTTRQLTWGDSTITMVSFITPIIFRDITVGYALLSFDHSVMNEAKRETLTTVITIILLMILLAIATSLYLGRRLTRPIDQLVMASHAFAEGRYDYRITDQRNDELGVLMKSLNTMGEGLLRKEQVEQVFSRYVSPQVAKRAIADLQSMESLQLGGRHVQASVLFADIVGFTSMSENMTPQEVSSLLNLYFSCIARAVHFCRGHIDKYMGDCAMIVFGVPEEYDEHPFNALACGWMILRLVESMNRQRKLRGQPVVEFRIGINSGMMLAGNMGSTERMEYTVVGDAVNLASRLSHAGDPGQVVLTEEMLGNPILADRVSTRHHGTIQLRGKKVPVSLFTVKEIHGPFREDMLQEIRRILASSTSEAA